MYCLPVDSEAELSFSVPPHLASMYWHLTLSCQLVLTAYAFFTHDEVVCKVNFMVAGGNHGLRVTYPRSDSESGRVKTATNFTFGLWTHCLTTSDCRLKTITEVPQGEDCKWLPQAHGIPDVATSSCWLASCSVNRVFPAIMLRCRKAAPEDVCWPGGVMRLHP